MDQKEMTLSLFAVGLFALGGVALILYQHSLHTGQIMGAIGAGSSDTPSAVVPAGAVMPGVPASLAGMPTPGQANLQAMPVAAMPIESGPGWTIN